MKYASLATITALWGCVKTALTGKVDTDDSRLSDSRTPTSHASTSTSYGASTDTQYGHAKASSTVPSMDGTASAGEETSSFARGDHVHPTDTSRASQEDFETLSEKVTNLSDNFSDSVASAVLDILVTQGEFNIPITDSDENELCDSDGNSLTALLKISIV